ncbi:MAG: hypothetical protein WCE54_20520 [Ignavibacteriaceae bacterium]
MSWHKIDLDYEEVLWGEKDKITGIINDVMVAFSERRYSKGIAIFEGREREKHFIYFSPASVKVPALVDLINIYSGLICKPPFKGSVHYLAGDLNYARFFL